MTVGAPPGARPESATPTAGAVPAGVQRLADLFNEGDVAGLITLAQPSQIQCEDGPYPLCRGQVGGSATGFPVAQHGGHGEAVDESGLRERLNAALKSRRAMTSVGCALGSADCGTFAVVFSMAPESPTQVFYLFGVETADGPILRGIGSSGDNADIFLRGGVSWTPLGEMAFTTR